MDVQNDEFGVTHPKEATHALQEKHFSGETCPQKLAWLFPRFQRLVIDQSTLVNIHVNTHS